MTTIQRSTKGLIIVWSAALICFFIAWALLSFYIIHTDRINSDQRHLERLSRDVVTSASVKEQEVPQPHKVKAGIYVERIIKLESTDTEWIAEFYLWLLTDEKGTHAGEGFQVLNGQVLSSELIKRSESDGQYYAMYKVIASITKFFNIVRYPLDDHLLTIQIEDKSHPLSELEYVADLDNSKVSSRLQAPGYEIEKVKVIVRQHAYQTGRGDPQLDNQPVLFSQLAVGLKIYRPDMGLYFKMFQGLFAAVMVAFITFFLGYEGGDRIGVGVGAFFASVANGYISMNELPHGGLLTLTDIVNGMGLFTVLMTIISAQIAAWLAMRKNQKSAAKLLDKISFAICLLGYVVVNVLVVKAA